jgi:hypothetical protein
MWISDPFVIRPTPHLETPTRRSSLEMLQVKESTPTFYPSIVFTLDS